MRKIKNQLQQRLSFLLETLMWGGRLRERLLVSLLERHYRSRFRREWTMSKNLPHFFNHQMGLFRFGFCSEGTSPFPFFRGFFNSELVQEKDLVLDIACGDGFFAKRFLSVHCQHIDAIDISHNAIATAATTNKANNIHFQKLDAIDDRFPRRQYDVILMDAAIKYLPEEKIPLLLSKIQTHLTPDGIFAGSAPLGPSDPQSGQYFGLNDIDTLDGLLKEQFHYRLFKILTHRVGTSGTVRREAFWRCTNSLSRLKQIAWQPSETFTRHLSAILLFLESMDLSDLIDLVDSVCFLEVVL